MDFPGGNSGKEPACQCRRCKRCVFDPWVRKIPLEEGMAIHSSILAWRILWIQEPGELQSIGSQRVRHDLSALAGRQARSDSGGQRVGSADRKGRDIPQPST